MQSIIWDKSLETGIEKIDSQHMELIQQINNFLEACMQQRSKQTIISTLNFVDDYVKKHFTDEQNLHVSSRYPKAEQHKIMHDKFRFDFQTLQRRLNNEGTVLMVMMDANQLLVNWLINHINVADKEFAAFYYNHK